MSGRHAGPLMGSEPTGKEFAVRHVYIWERASGLAAYIRDAAAAKAATARA